MRLALVSLLLPLAASAADVAALPMAVEPSDAHLHYSGRWDRSDKAGPRCEWTAGQLRFVFEGSAANILLKGGKDHAFQVVVDGKPTGVVTIVPGQSVYEVASGLPAGQHSVELCKRTESWGGPVQVLGLQFAAGSKLLPPPTFKHRIEFLGDSITCGYGNEAKAKEEHFSYPTENAWLAWGAVTARTLDAELSVEAISGIWLMDNGKKKPLPALWGSTMPFTAPKPWDFAQWQADVVVVDLGTNDLNGQPKGEPIDQQKWHDAYVGLIGQIRTAYPKAHIFLCIGPMGHGRKGEIPGYNEAIAKECADKGDTMVHALALANQQMSDGIGADWHPSAKTHEKMSAQIVAAIRKELGW